VTIAGRPRCPLWCRLVTVPTDPFTTLTRPTGPFSDRIGKVPTRKHPKWRNRWQILNRKARIPIRDERSDNADHFYSWPPPIVAGQLITETQLRLTYRQTLVRTYSPEAATQQLTPSMRGSLKLSGLYYVCETRMAGLQSGECRMMIDSVVWAQYINVTDSHTDSHTATSS